MCESKRLFVEEKRNEGRRSVVSRGFPGDVSKNPGYNRSFNLPVVVMEENNFVPEWATRVLQVVSEVVLGCTQAIKAPLSCVGFVVSPYLG